MSEVYIFIVEIINKLEIIVEKQLSRSIPHTYLGVISNSFSGKALLLGNQHLQPLKMGHSPSNSLRVANVSSDYIIQSCSE